VRLRLLTARKPDPAITAINPPTNSHSTFAPVVARVGVVVVVVAGAAAETQGSEDACHSRKGYPLLNSEQIPQIRAGFPPVGSGL
jgi:hypothetical protein